MFVVQQELKQLHLDIWESVILKETAAFLSVLQLSNNDMPNFDNWYCREQPAEVSRKLPEKAQTFCSDVTSDWR